MVRPARGLPASSPVTLVASQPRLTIQPPSVEAGQNVTAAMADLIKTLSYTLDWKDGPPITFTAADVVATQTHTYAVPGIYQVELTSASTNPVSAPVTVRPAAPTLQLVANDLSVTLTATKLYAGVTYTINWGGRRKRNLPGQRADHDLHPPLPRAGRADGHGDSQRRHSGHGHRDAHAPGAHAGA